METPQVFNISFALEQLAGDVELLDELIHIGISDAHSRIQAIKDTGITNDLELLRRAAHSMKSAFGNLGAERAQQAAHDLETAVLNNQHQSLDIMLNKLHSEIDQFEKAYHAKKQSGTL